MARTIRRALDIFEAFDEHHRRMTLAEISSRVGLARTTCLRLLQSLEADGYLVRVADHEQYYCLSLKFFSLANNVDSTLDIRTIAYQLLRDLVQQTGETVTLNMRDGKERVCIDVALPNADLVRIVKTGERVGLPLGAIGRVLTAYGGDEALLEVVASSGINGHGRDDFLDRLKEIPSRGYDIAFGERIAGTTAIAAPIHDASGHVEHCVCVLGPSVRVDDRTGDIVKKLLATTNKISLQIGYTGTSAV
jgi:DNA-binding IclR family transcriptional regulator